MRIVVPDGASEEQRRTEIRDGLAAIKLCVRSNREPDKPESGDEHPACLPPSRFPPPPAICYR